MSKSRGGKRGGGNINGIRQISDALGIPRNELVAYTTLRKEPPPLYPTLNRDPLPLSNAKELEYMVDITQELLQRFHDSPFYLEQEEKQDVRRYTDKYCATKKDEFEPFWNRIPAELNWKPKTVKSAKKRKLDKSDGLTEEKLKRLEQAENLNKSQEALAPIEQDEDEDEQEEPGMGDDDEEVSDEDYQEGENDYVHTYFDAGDDFDADDDNIDEDGY